MTTQPDLFTKFDNYDKSVPVIAEDKTNMFVSDSRINARRLAGQNLRLLQHLLSGKTISIFSEAKKELRIGYLNSRISDLKNKFEIEILSDMVVIDGVSCKKYLMTEMEIKKTKLKFGL